MIVVGGQRSSSITTRVYDDDGTALWTADHGDTVYGVAIDSGGYVYTAGIRSSNITTRKYDPDGNAVWTADHGDNVYAIAVDGSGNVYTTGNRTSSITTRKYNNSGTEQWTADHGAFTLGIAVDNSGNVYIGGGRISSITTRKYNSSGTEQWTADHGGTVRGCAVSSGGILVTSGNRVSGLCVDYYASNGTLIFSRDTFATAYSAAIDGNGNLYAGSDISISGVNLWGWTSSGGTYLGNININSSATVYGIAVDNNAPYSNIYLASSSTGSKTLLKIDVYGTEQWSANHGSSLYAVDWAPSGITTTIPALAVKISLAVPTHGGFIVMPSLPLRIGLATPNSVTPIPPTDYGPTIWAIFRAYLTGVGSDPYQIQISNISCRRRLGETTWLSVSCKNWTANLLSDIQARINGEIVIFSGTVNGDGTESLGLFLRAILTEVNYDRGPFDAEIRMTGRMDTPTYSPTTKPLIGIRDYSIENGLRSVRCDFNPLVNPGDTVTGFGDSFIADKIEYQISYGDAFIIITESA